MMHKNGGVYNNQTSRVDYSISFARMVAMVFIILCHLLKYYGNLLTYWFDVGVQMFLCISGYLHGSKNIKQIREFYISRAKRILIPYYIVLIPAIVIEVVLFRDSITGSHIFNSLAIRGTIPSGGHLWFIPLILFCYIITPILFGIKENTVVDNKSFLSFIIISSVFTGGFCLSVCRYYNVAWVFTYVISYSMGSIKGKQFEKQFLYLFVALAILFNGTQIYIEWMTARGLLLIGRFSFVYNYFSNFAHAFLGIALFLTIKSFFTKIRLARIRFVHKILDISDQYSYEVFLTHHFLILGPLSLMSITSYPLINICVVLLFIVISSKLLRVLEAKILGLLDCTDT